MKRRDDQCKSHHETGERYQLHVPDGINLSATWFVPKNEAARAVAVIACGGGIPAKFYSNLARYLAERGIAVLTFDYRGIGESRPRSLRGFPATLDLWAERDLGAALQHARDRFPNVSLGIITHSISAMFVGAAPCATEIVHFVAFGPHTGYWRDYNGRYRWLLFVTWHWLMPLVTKIVGFFPGRSLGLGEDLPSGFALEWGRHRAATFDDTAPDPSRRRSILAKYGRITAKTLVFSATDDAFAPPAAANRFQAAYPGLYVVHKVVSPRDLHTRRLGHLGFLRRPTSFYFWEKTAAWLLHGTDVGEALLD